VGGVNGGDVQMDNYSYAPDGKRTVTAMSFLCFQMDTTPRPRGGGVGRAGELDRDRVIELSRERVIELVGSSQKPWSGYLVK